MTGQTRRQRSAGGLPRTLAWVAVLGTLGVLAGLLAGSRLPPSTTATASVLVQPLPGNAFSTRSGDVLEAMQTEAELPRSDEVMSRVASAPGALSVPQMRPRIRVRTLADAGVLVISFQGANAAQARDLVQRIASATLAVRKDRASAVNAERAAALESFINDSELDLDAALDAERRRPALIRTLSQRLVGLRGDLRSVTATEPNAGEVITTYASAKTRGLLAAALVVGGLLLGGAAGWLASRRKPAPMRTGRSTGLTSQSRTAVSG